uniref:EGF-like domain-containing protein n=1 Tax=Oryzias latipes TaxID=8090 RepID=A0A3P9J732_ORYLA
MSRTSAASSSSTAPLTTDLEASKRTEKSVTAQTASHSSLSSSPENQTQEGELAIIVHGGAAGGTPGDKQSFSWRSQRSTNRLNYHLTSTATSDLLKSSAAPPHSSSANADTEPTSSLSSPTAHIPQRSPAVGAAEAAAGHPRANRSDSLASSAVAHPTTVEFKSKHMQQNLTPFGASSSPESTDGLVFRSAQREDKDAQTESPEKVSVFPHVTTEITSTLPGGMKDGQTSAFTGSLSVTRAAQATQVQNLTSAETTGEQLSTYTVLHDSSPTGWLLSSLTTDSSTPPYTLQPHSELSVDNEIAVISSVSESNIHTIHQRPLPSGSHSRQLLPTPTSISPTFELTQHIAASAYTTAASPAGSDKEEEGEFRSWSPTAQPLSRFTHTASAGTSTPTQSSTSSPMFFIVPNQPAAIREDSVELLLQIIVEEAKSALEAGLEEDTAVWMEPYLQRAPGFSKLLGVWSSGHAVQSLVAFKTRGVLQWLNMTGSASLLERTGLAQAVREAKTFRSSRVTNITIGGLQGDVCGWLLQCPEGYKCVLQPGSTNYSCSSVCHFDHCHHHGICTHHPDQLPVCRCLVGDDFWYMGQRCDTKMTRARLVSACLAILLIAVIVIGTLAYVAVRRYRDILIQAKVDQTRSSYRRFNHFDELSGRFWLRSWAGSADSLDNLCFTHSDDVLHLRARDHPCCFHDDTLSLPSTCPSHGAHINTIYPHSSQYGWRGSGVSVGDGVLDSGKASDLSVCSWPVEPIHWTPFPLLQQLASHRTPAQVRVSRPRSYCEGMELVDMGKSWTA